MTKQETGVDVASRSSIRPLGPRLAGSAPAAHDTNGKEERHDGPAV